jgi:AraC-like DNA-binding protein
MKVLVREIASKEEASALEPTPKLWLDALDQALEGIVLNAWVAPPLSHRPPWKLAVKSDNISFYAVLAGRCRIERTDGPWSARLTTGDLIITRDGNGLELSHDRGARVPAGGGNEPTVLLSGGCLPRDGGRTPLLLALPAVIHVRGTDEKFPPWAEGVLELIRGELELKPQRTQSVVTRLVGVLLIKAMRHELESLAARSALSLRQSLDEDIGRALGTIHSRPDLPWTVASLAAAVGLSRSAFAVRFARIVGRTPLDYLREYRMQEAARLLRDDHCGLKEVAQRTGYRTASALSVAFKRWSGMAPGNYRGQPPAPVEEIPARDGCAETEWVDPAGSLRSAD